MFRVVHGLSIPSFIINCSNGSMSNSSTENYQPKYSISFSSYPCVLHVPPTSTFIFNHANNETYEPKWCSSFSSYPWELNVPPIWTYLFNYPNDIRWGTQIIDWNEQNLLSALHIWSIPLVQSISGDVYKLLSSSLRISLLSASCGVHWKQLSHLLLL
jgi:hypothetical protein